uniref:Uncharacterized protein n=1 Tax=Siphoviridae sp. ctxMM9 TaxID=2827973 RepID=A0A8S5T7W6_9CAUD|nr:MAG TPA: hypothetical protein [Siphoviridae sp. ctxMM9]
MGDIPLGIRGRAYSEVPTFSILRKRDGPT